MKEYHLQKNVNMIVGSLGRGGTEKFVIEFANYLAEQKYNVKIIPIEAQIDTSLVNKLNRNIELTNGTQGRIKKIFLILKLNSQLQNDAEFTLLFHNLGKLAGLCIRKKRQKSLISTRRREQPSRRQFILRAILYLSDLKSDLILCNSPLLIPTGKFSSKSLWFPNGVQSVSHRESKVYESRPFKILTVSNLRREKGLFQLLKISEKYKFRDVLFEIYGEGELREPIEERIKELDLPVKLMGQSAELSSIFRASDLYLHTSTSEGFSNSIIEAMSHALPIVSSNVGAASVCLGGDEFLYEAADLNKAYLLIERFRGDNSLRTMVGRGNVRRVEENFLCRVIFPEILEAIENVSQ
jgi:glycosyltransferase involved in cell wall biosynthesis